MGTVCGEPARQSLLCRELGKRGTLPACLQAAQQPLPHREVISFPSGREMLLPRSTENSQISARKSWQTLTASLATGTSLMRHGSVILGR